MAIAAFFIISAHGQGFLNLNFESAQNLTNDEYDEYIPVSSALPGWTAYDADVALSDVYYTSNAFSGFYTSVELVGGSLALSGDFSAALDTGASISQTGLVPANAESLQFDASSSALNLIISLGGQNLTYSTLSTGPNYTVYGANIPAALDGQMETLDLFLNGGQSLLDNIEFSTMSVPEPSEWALIGVGAILFGFCRRRRRTVPSDSFSHG